MSGDCYEGKREAELRHQGKDIKARLVWSAAAESVRERVNDDDLQSTRVPWYSISIHFRTFSVM